MKEYNSIEEMRKDIEHFTEHQYEYGLMDNQKYILCGSDKVIDEEIWNDLYNSITSFYGKFDGDIEYIDDTEDRWVEMVDTFRDILLKEYLKSSGVTFVLPSCTISYSDN